MKKERKKTHVCGVSSIIHPSVEHSVVQKRANEYVDNVT